MGDLIVAGGVGAIVVMQGLILAKLNKIDALSEITQRHEITLFGANGDNGHAGTLKSHGIRIESLERYERTA